jgi:hypothetical protein
LTIENTLYHHNGIPESRPLRLELVNSEQLDSCHPERNGRRLSGMMPQDELACDTQERSIGGTLRR